MIQIRPSTQSQFLVSMSPFSHYWTSYSGLRDTAASSSYPDPIRQRIFQLKGPKTLSEATFSTPFDPIVHADIIDFYKSGDNCSFLTATIQPVTCGEDPRPLGSRTLILLDCQVSSLNFGTVDKSSANPSTIEVTLICNDFTYA
jgi:hypothetical protein